MSAAVAGAGLAEGFRLLEPAASTAASSADSLFGVMLLLCGAVALAVCTLVVVFAWRYRRGSRVHRLPPRNRVLWLEVTWTLPPLAIFIALFATAAQGYLRLYEPPANALPVVVVARQWMWKLQHRNGRREINELHVPLGQPVVLTMTSQDAIHSFYVPAFRLKQDVLPGRTTRLWFTATRLGEFRLFCAEYCGSQHSHMLGRVVVMRPAEFSEWLAKGEP
ncbi:MAG: cytochrome c oxidase subunit II [Rubrivivax sp.]